MRLKTYKTGNVYVISRDDKWLPGIFADEEAAQHALLLEYDTLHELNKRICRIDGENRHITIDDLRAYKPEIKSHTGDLRDFKP